MNKPSLEESKLLNNISPNELKVLKLKINRLHNRGSLTDEEARNMLGKIINIPVSPTHQGLDQMYHAKIKVVEKIEDEESPVTETREKQEKFGGTLCKEISKKIKNKPATRKHSAPLKKISRNSSLPKAMSISKYKSKEKIKAIKFKAKSPHSFM